MHQFPNLAASQFHYHLPDELIARFPLEKRDESNLLVYRKGQIKHSQFKHIGEELTADTTLFFNNTRVIPARLHFRKESGGEIEIFLLNPVQPAVVSQAMLQTQNCVWKCIIGGLKKWKEGIILERTLQKDTPTGNQTWHLQATLTDRAEQLVEFRWVPADLPFAEVLATFGNTPLPPYLKREVVAQDKQNYQTVYAKNEGAVAAPTAGLHFTPEVLEGLQAKGIVEDFLTLHVGGGTFQPIRTEDVIAHAMHTEQIIVSRENICNLLAARKVCAVGTTSMRTLESVYWLALEVWKNNPTVKENLKNGYFFISKLQPYEQDFAGLPTCQEVMQNLLAFMDSHQLNHLTGETQIMIVPSYVFQCCTGLITNFHQPETTLMLLVAAFVGEDWRKIYQEALANHYRFLSFGDSSLLLP